MKKKNICLFFFIVILVLIICILVIKNNNKIPDNYIAVFHGGIGEITYETYIYKNKNDNSKVNYINVTSTTVSYGSTKWKHKITKRGVSSKKDIFEVSKKNNAYSYVTISSGSEIYSIDQYKDIFYNQN